MVKLDDFLKEPTMMKAAIDAAGVELKKHPNIYKCAIIVDHLLNASKMYALVQILPYSKCTNCVVTGISSLYYRVTAEGPCAFRFSIISCFGGAAFISARIGMIEFARGTAFRSLALFLKSSCTLAPLSIYLFCIVKFTNDDVDAYLARGTGGTCCTQKEKQ